MVIISLVTSCSSCKYEHDVSFLGSALANSPEFLIKFKDKNGQTCKDVDGKIGLCAKRIRANEKLSLWHMPRPYSYTLKITCTGNYEETISIQKNESYILKIDTQLFPKTFFCRGEVFPNVRKSSAFWDITIIKIDERYEELEKPRVVKNRFKTKFYLGVNSRFSTRLSKNKTKHYSKKTLINFYRNSDIISESQNMRFGYHETRKPDKE
jgi:hypothetical protein